MSDIQDPVEAIGERAIEKRAREKLNSEDEIISGESHGYTYSVYEVEDTAYKRYGLTFYDPEIADGYIVGSFYFHHLDGMRNFLEELTTKVRREITE